MQQGSAAALQTPVSSKRNQCFYTFKINFRSNRIGLNLRIICGLRAAAGPKDADILNK